MYIVMKRFKNKNRDLNRVKLCFISETEGHLAISWGESVRVHSMGVGWIF
jgi:hypothetical protein